MRSVHSLLCFGDRGSLFFGTPTAHGPEPPRVQIVSVGPTCAIGGLLSIASKETGDGGFGSKESSYRATSLTVRLREDHKGWGVMADTSGAIRTSRPGEIRFVALILVGVAASSAGALAFEVADCIRGNHHAHFDSSKGFVGPTTSMDTRFERVGLRISSRCQGPDSQIMFTPQR